MLRDIHRHPCQRWQQIPATGRQSYIGVTSCQHKSTQLHRIRASQPADTSRRRCTKSGRHLVLTPLDAVAPSQGVSSRRTQLQQLTPPAPRPGSSPGGRTKPRQTKKTIFASIMPKARGRIRFLLSWYLLSRRNWETVYTNPRATLGDGCFCQRSRRPAGKNTRPASQLWVETDEFWKLFNNAVCLYHEFVSYIMDLLVLDISRILTNRFSCFLRNYQNLAISRRLCIK
ncbi:unnamed protein product [Nesidiocoris tenuis]|uniref:Uncharacterized protein n=1 Tax=Nesidiocoris tenuis TaxID=355587 RepID=A0A6H5HHH9_9HEMI|nr:unnamed protein product [Nesidiocoris tenuis]